MKKFLQCLGIFAYSVIASYLLWLFFYWITPIVMGIGWIIFFICLIFTAGLLTAAANFVSTILALLTIPLTRDNIVAKILNAIPFLLLGIDAVCMPWQLSIEYGFLQWVLGISLTNYGMHLVMY